MTEHDVEIEILTPDAALHGDLTVPDTERGIVIFAHGSGSSRLSPRNRKVAGFFRERGFGASTGAAAALVAAAHKPQAIQAVSRENEEARARLQCASELVVIPGATHLFEEPGTLDQVAEHAAQWFVRHFGAEPQNPKPQARTETETASAAIESETRVTSRIKDLGAPDPELKNSRVAWEGEEDTETLRASVPEESVTEEHYGYRPRPHRGELVPAHE